MKPIILDKSYLQGISQAKYQELSEQFQFLMPDVLFYELITCDEPARKRCFEKFPQKNNPIPVVKSVWELLRMELAAHRPSGLPSDNLDDLPRSVIWRFHSGLREGTYILTDDDKAAIRDIEAELDRDAEMLMDFTYLEASFPDIRTGTTEKQEKYKSECEQDIAGNIEKQSDFLSKFELPVGTTMPPKNILNRSWTLMRWLQVRLLFSLDIYHRYGAVDFSKWTQKQKEKLKEDKIKHDVLDMWYLIPGVLQRGFATNETKLIRFYELLCPDGMLLTMNPTQAVLH